MDINDTKIEVYVFTSLVSLGDEDDLNDNNDIKFTVIPTNNFSKEDVIKFMIEISKKLPVTLICALIKEALMKFFKKKKVEPEPSKFVVTIKKTEHEETYEFVSDFPISEKSVDMLIESIASRINSGEFNSEANSDE